MAALADDGWRQWHWWQHWQWRQRNSGNGRLGNNQLKLAATVMETVAVMVAQHAEMVVAVVAEAEGNAGENRGSGTSV